MFQRVLPFLLFAAHVTLWVAAAKTLGTLEGPYPDHFDISGEPDSWTDAGWWLMPLIAAFITAFLVGIVLLARRWVRTRPEIINIPRKADFLRLDPEARQRAFAPVVALVIGTAFFMNLIFTSIVFDTYAVAVAMQGGLSMIKLILALVFMVVWVVLSLVRIRRAIEHELSAAKS